MYIGVATVAIELRPRRPNSLTSSFKMMGPLEAYAAGLLSSTHTGKRVKPPAGLIRSHSSKRRKVEEKPTRSDSDPAVESHRITERVSLLILHPERNPILTAPTDSEYDRLPRAWQASGNLCFGRRR